MPYRFHPAESSVGAEIQRLFTEELGSAAGHLVSAVTEDRDHHVHEARKNLKKLRALLRLLSPQLPASTFKSLNRSLRDVGRQVSQLRDAEAMLESVRALPEELLPAGAREAAHSRLEAEKAQIFGTIDAPEVLQRAANQLETVRSEVSQLDWNEVSYSDLADGVQSIYKQGRHAWKLARKNPTPDLLHDFRKRVKDHWYHTRLLEEAAPDFAAERLENLRSLEQLLGDAHNLHLLGGVLDTKPKQPLLRDALRLVNAHEKELEERALQVARNLYAERPKLLVNKLHVLEPSAIR